MKVRRKKEWLEVTQYNGQESLIVKPNDWILINFSKKEINVISSDDLKANFEIDEVAISDMENLLGEKL